MKMKQVLFQLLLFTHGTGIPHWISRRPGRSMVLYW